MELLVVGGGGQIAGVLVREAAARGDAVTVISRSPRPPDLPDAVLWCRRDDHTSETTPDAVVHLAPIHTIGNLRDVLPRAKEPRDSVAPILIALSSVSVKVRADARDPEDRAYAERLAEGEGAAGEIARTHGYRLCILRPTLIYGGGDHNVELVRRVIRRFGFFPVPMGRLGLRQPVHRDDVVSAILRLLTYEASLPGSMDLGGVERIDYGEFVCRIFRSEGLAPRLLRLPAWTLRVMVASLSRLSAYSMLRPSLVDRMREDIVAEDDAWLEDLGVKPRGFEP